MTTIILAHDAFLEGEAKTAEALIRYGTDPVAAVVDRTSTGTDASQVVGPPGEGVPVVASIEDALATEPDRLVIGVAPVGGRLPAAWRKDVERCLKAGVDVASGLHDHLSEDADLAATAKAGGARIRDVRRPPAEKPIYSGRVLDLDATIVLTIGTDCSSGKMTTTVELVDALRERGIATGFAATGQTGLLLGPDAGVPIDAVPADFTAGFAEQIVLEAHEARQAEIIVVEGQGALSHPAYAGVSLGLLHGTSPHACILCHDAQRDVKGATFHDGRQFTVLDPAEEWRLVEQLASVIREPTLAGLSVMNGPLAPGQTDALPDVPQVDVLAEGPGRLADAVEALA